jgi:peroxiredoxin Q/BCP
MAQLRQDYPAFALRETEVIAIGPDTKEVFAAFWREHSLPFTGLPDPQAALLNLYGQEVSLFKFGRMPAQVIVDKQGIVRFAHYGKSMSDIPENSELLEILDKLNQEEHADGVVADVVGNKPS